MSRHDLRDLNAAYQRDVAEHGSLLLWCERNEAESAAETAAFERTRGGSQPRRPCTLCGGDGLHCNAVDCPAQFGRRERIEREAFWRGLCYGIGLAATVGLIAAMTWLGPMISSR